MSQAFEDYKDSFYYSDKQLNPDFLNLLTEEERLIVEEDIVRRFSENNFTFLSNVLKLKHFNGVELLKNKLNEDGLDIKSLISINLMLYESSRDDTYLINIEKYILDPLYCDYIFARLSNCLSNPTSGLVKLIRFAALNIQDVSLKKSAFLKLLIIADLANSYSQGHLKYPNEITSIYNNDLNFNLEKFIDENIMPNIEKKM